MGGFPQFYGNELSGSEALRWRCGQGTKGGVVLPLGLSLLSPVYPLKVRASGNLLSLVNQAGLSPYHPAISPGSLHFNNMV